MRSSFRCRRSEPLLFYLNKRQAISVSFIPRSFLWSKLVLNLCRIPCSTKTKHINFPSRQFSQIATRLVSVRGRYHEVVKLITYLNRQRGLCLFSYQKLFMVTIAITVDDAECSWRDQNVDLYDSIPLLSEKIKSRRLALAGHCFCYPEQPAGLTIAWEPTHGRHNLDRSAKTMLSILS